MAAMIDSFEPFRTPNLLDASIAVDPNQMDGYFNDKMDIEKNDYFDPESWTLFPQDQRQSDVDEANDFTMPSDEFTYPNIVTPPPSAKEAPADWALQPMKSEANFFANPLHQIDTTQNTLNARFDWGQPTPPDEVGSPGCQFPGPATTSIKQESEEVESKPAISRRKKSTDNAEGQPKRRRPRKSVSAASSAMISSNPDASGEPQDEDRRNRFLERNRVAASKCRQKKKEWTQNLESHARDLHANNHQLQVLVGSLKDEVMYLRTEMLRHGSCECTGIREYLAREADMLAAGTSPRTPGSQHRSSLSSAVSSPRQSVASVPNFNLDPTLRNKATESQRKSSKSSAGRADSVSSTSST